MYYKHFQNGVKVKMMRNNDNFDVLRKIAFISLFLLVLFLIDRILTQNSDFLLQYSFIYPIKDIQIY